MNSKRVKKIAIIHNQDFPSSNTTTTATPPVVDEPPSYKQQFEINDPGLKARADVEKVANHVCDALSRLGHKDVSIIPIQDLSDLYNLKNVGAFDLVFNLCESLAADPRMEPKVIKVLEDIGMPFTGNSSLPLTNCLNKFFSYQCLTSQDVLVPQSFLVDNMIDVDQLENIFTPNKRFIVKPNSEDGSVAIDSGSIISTTNELKSQCFKLKSLGIRDIIVQEFIDGREFNLALLNPKKKKYSLSEISFKKLPIDMPKILMYAAKWDEDSIEYKTTKSVQPKIKSELKQKLLNAALKASEILGIDAYARFDFRVDSLENPYLIDINPNCDLAPGAGFSNSFAFKNIGYDQVIEQVISQANY